MLVTLRRTQLKWLIYAEMVGWPVSYTDIVYVYGPGAHNDVHAAWAELKDMFGDDVLVQVIMHDYRVGSHSFRMGWAPGVVVVLLLK